YFFFSSRRRHTRCLSDWSSDVCLPIYARAARRLEEGGAHLPKQLEVSLGLAITLHVLRSALDVEAHPRRHALPALRRLLEHACEIGRASCRERAALAVGRARGRGNGQE